MGIAALQAISRAADQIGPPTALQTVILHHLGLPQPQALIAWTYSDLSWARFAELAPLVVQCAKAQDAVALQIVEETALGLAAAVEAVIRRLDFQAEAFPLVLAGGNLQPGLLRDQLYRHLDKLVPQAHIISPNVEPAVGAAWLALKRKLVGWLVG
jgi:N-acetylglucosamine kinase-like BadF-type ATPase